MGIVKIETVALENVGADFSFGGITGANFQPQYILFYRLKIIRNGQDDPTKWAFQYPLCGVYTGVNIGQFVELAQQDDLPPLSPTSDSPLDAASITVTDPCYVVIQLTSTDASMRFQDGHEAIKTADDHRSQYRRLAHVDDQGNVHFGTATTNCTLIYFAVKTITQTNEDHHYNIYVQYDDQAVVLRVVDPAIKNRGGDDDAMSVPVQPGAGDPLARRRLILKPAKQTQPYVATSGGTVPALSQAA